MTRHREGGLSAEGVVDLFRERVFQRIDRAFIVGHGIALRATWIALTHKLRNGGGVDQKPASDLDRFQRAVVDPLADPRLRAAQVIGGLLCRGPFGCINRRRVKADECGQQCEVALMRA